MTFFDWWRTRLVPPAPTRAQLRRAAREAWAAGVAAERERCAAVRGGGTESGSGQTSQRTSDRPSPPQD